VYLYIFELLRAFTNSFLPCLNQLTVLFLRLNLIRG